MRNWNRRSFGFAMLGAVGLGFGVRPAQAADEAQQALDQMVAALQNQPTNSFDVEFQFGSTAGDGAWKTLGSTAHVVSERGERLLARYDGGSLALLSTLGEVTLLRPDKGIKATLTPGASGTAFAVPGLLLPYLGLLSKDVNAALFGKIQSVTHIAQGTPEQPETTVLVAVLSQLFTGEIWINKSNSMPARMIGTFFDGAGGAAASASMLFPQWSAAPVTDEAFDLPALATAKTVPLGDLGL